ncbi:PGC-1 and ERR-induced regulator in muscle protein 1 [Python bivittatus]|uniref:PGC-1 and ERR-induced regulator in muscle protein 1 n=1 Tax=Python bivittatus TaxID=176946 RepID=A0A9F2R8S9_PYTBI|nr:PGC-1 and ERR-induced regulator in muscle protein 1 [Python bivittatus]
MENFQYSIQLNDWDWAEFYLASEECRLIPPALATAEDQLLSDSEDGEAEEKRGIQETAGPAPAHRKASCPSRESPSGHLLAEDVLSGSEDETDLGSVGRFLCGSPPVLLPSRSLPSQLSGLTSNPLRSWPQLPGPATSSALVSAAEEEGAARAGWPMDPKTKVEAPATQGRGLQEPRPRPEMGESSLVPPLSLSAAEATESPEGANGLELQRAQDNTSPTASAGCPFPGSTGNTGKLEFPKPRDAASPPGSIKVPSLLSSEAEKEVKGLPTDLGTPFQEKHSPSQEHSVQLANIRERTSGKKEEDARPLKSERGADHSRSLSPNTSQEGDQVKDDGVHGSPGALEENGCPKPSLGAEARRRASSPGKVETQNNGEPCLHLGLVTPPEGEHPARIQGSQRLVSYPLKSNDSPEHSLTTMTWPEVYDYFFYNDPQEVERPAREERSRQTSNSHQSELPAMSGPEMYEYFFLDADEETGGKASPSETSLSSDRCVAPSDAWEEPASDVTADPMGFPEVYEHFFAHHPRGKRSQRQNFLAVPASELRKALRALTSLVRRPVRFLRSQPKQRGSQARVMVLSPTLLPLPGERRYPRPENLGVAVLQPERPLQLVLTPRDMCLGFLAFASWAVKTSDLRAPDAWKIVLLANVGTLSAIRYFRRHVVTESHPGT